VGHERRLASSRPGRTESGTRMQICTR
jgi:hypothetical protein